MHAGRLQLHCSWGASTKLSLVLSLSSQGQAAATQLLIAMFGACAGARKARKELQLVLVPK